MLRTLGAFYKIMEEIWKDIEGFEESYEVSNYGRIRCKHLLSQKRNGSRLMNTHYRDGREVLGLTKNGKQTTYSVHKIVAQHFVPNPLLLPFISHKDGNKQNNRADNLEWTCWPKRVLGIGVNNIAGAFSKGSSLRVPYKMWDGMLVRCYDERLRLKHPTYANCIVCEEWKCFGNFLKWFQDPINGYQSGYQIDKDILSKGNRVYSPQTCCFVPQEINKLFTKNTKCRGVLPIGVCLQRSGRFRAVLQYNRTTESLGTYDTKELAFEAYKAAKEKRIKQIANEYFKRGKITERVYNALMNYNVEITD